MEKRNQTSRRAFLRGVGTCVALPALQSLEVHTGWCDDKVSSSLAVTPSGAPLRAAFLFFPNGAIPQAWWPSGTEGEFALSQTLRPLESVRSQVQILKGMDNKSAEGGPDGGGDHARGNGTFLTGVRIKKSATDIQAGPSIDQMIASQIGHLTRFPSLELASDPTRQTSGCDSGYSCAYQFNISWKSKTTPVATENNPRLVFERLFGEGAPGQRAASLARRRAEQRSVLDFVLEDARAMQRRVAASDRRKVDEFLSSVRSLESRIERAERFGDPRDPEIETPVGIPQSHQEYVDLMYELTAVAFHTDSTRVVSLMLGHDGDNRSYDFLNIPQGHHDLTHHQNKEERIQKVEQIDLWYVQQFAKFLNRLQELKDADDCSVLHNSMIVFGSGNADGNRHTHSDLPILLAGQGGGQLRPGRFVDHQSKPLTNLYRALAGRMGVELSEFGDSTDALENI